MPTSSTRSTRKRRNPNSRTSSQNNKQLRLLDGPLNEDLNSNSRIQNIALKQEMDDDYDGGASTPPDPLSPSSEDGGVGGGILDAHVLRSEIESQKSKLEMVVAFIDQMKVEQQNKINAVQTYNDMVLQALAKRISSQEEQLQAIKEENQALRDKLQDILAAKNINNNNNNNNNNSNTDNGDNNIEKNDSGKNEKIIENVQSEKIVENGCAEKITEQ